MSNTEQDSKRHVFYVDVGSMSPEEALAYLGKVREEYKRKRDASK